MIFKMGSHAKRRAIYMFLYGLNLFLFVENKNVSITSKFNESEDELYEWFYGSIKPINRYHIDKDTNSSVLQTEFDSFLSGFIKNPLQYRVLYDQLKYCPFIPLCTSNWTVYNRESDSFCCKKCSCESDCWVYGTCCPDIIPSTIYYQVLQNRDCLPLIFKSYAILPPTESVYAYTTCPHGTDLVTRDLCTSRAEDATTLLDILPILDKNNVTYKNVYCAQCNFADNTTFWAPKIICRGGQVRYKTEKELIKAILKHPTCDMVFEAPDTVAAIGRNKCDIMYESVSRCNATGLWAKYDPFYEWACGLYYSQVKINNISFHNIFCALCNGFEDVNYYCFESIYTYVHKTADRESPTPTPGSVLSAAVNIGDIEEYNAKYSQINVEHNEYNDEVSITNSTVKCENGYVNERDMCIQAKCSSVRVLNGNKCEKITSSSFLNSYKISYRLIPQKFLQTKIVYDIVATLEDSIEHNILKSIEVAVEIDDVKSILVTNRRYHTSMTIDEIFDSLVTYIDILYKFNVYDTHDPEYVLQMVRNKSKEPVNAGHDKVFDIHIKDDPGNRYKRIEHKFTQFFINRSISDRIIDFLPDLNTENEYTKLAVLPNDFNVPIFNVFDYTGKYVNILSMKACPFVELSNDSLTLTETITGLKLSNGYPSLKFSEFLYSTDNPGAISVCLDTYIDIIKFTVPKKIDSIRKYEDIVSVICVALSILCLLFTCVTFIILPSFKSLPWRNNLALSLSLLLTHIMYLLSFFLPLDKKSVYCKLLGLLFHFFLLQYIFWMNICTIHMYRVLTKNKLMSTTSGGKRLFLYAAYSFIASACFVTINILYSTWGKNVGDFGYGGIVCYINSQFMVNISFGVPLILVLVSNLVMLFLVILKIKKTSKVQKNIRNDTHVLKIIAKLTVITGLTWVFGLLQMFVSHPVFSFIFIVVNGSHGVFLMISFVFNKKTIAMYKTTLSSSGNKSVDSSTKTSP